MDHNPLEPLSLAQARDIIARPGPATTDQQRLLAWAILKTARGQTFYQPRIRRAQLAQRRGHPAPDSTRDLFARRRGANATSWPDDAA
ncbi:hypothetical protein [Roseicitreum antarcticum]|uniref:Uncharacterized protein n=1 Tax=Roseicitreum antarcticum TaxID=564137 RepID=A0A1H2WAG2_9RHOB|nr:hypothetical protein [Roseicitreum antarcticum]SDW77517.1 hypothetical protein SAMN04488238_103318 [Roseicitreum antarcticum]